MPPKDDKQPTVGLELLRRREQADKELERIDAQEARLREERATIIAEMVGPLVVHQGHVRLVTGTAKVTDAVPESKATVEAKPMYIKRAGPTTKAERELVGLPVFVQAFDPEDSVSRSYIFNPENRRFDLQPVPYEGDIVPEA